MKYLITTTAALVLVGCGPKAPDISIHEAANNGNVEAVKQHLADGADVNRKDDGGYTPLHYAVQSHLIPGSEDQPNKKITELLIANGADVNARGPDGRTPLYGAVALKHNEVVELLIAKGADVNAKNKLGMTPLKLAVLMNRKIVDLLRKHGGKTGEELKPEKNDQKNIEALKNFSEINELLRSRTSKSKDDIETVKRYLSSGADVNQRNKFGGSLLHIASVQGDKQLVRLLISEGAQLNVKNNRAMTPLDVSIKFKRTETINLLRKHGAKTAEELKAEGK